MSRLALPLLVLALTGSPAQAGLIAAAQTLPFIVLGLPAGALLDRVNRKVVMILCDIARCLIFGSVPVVWWLGQLTVVHLYVVALVHGTALVFFNIAQLAALPRVVPRAQLARAHSLNTASEGIASLISPGIGGFIISLGRTTPAGAALAYLIDSVSYLISAVMLGTIRAPFQAQRAGSSFGRLHQQILAGLQYIWARWDLRALVVVNGLHRMAFAPVQLAVVVLTTVGFGAEAWMVGLLFSAAGSGGLLASVVTPWLRARVSVGATMFGIMVVHTVALAVIATAPTPAVAAAGMFFGGMMETMTGIVQVAYRLVVIPDEIQARVHSTYRLVSFTAVTFGTAAGGILLATIGPRLLLGVLAGIIGLLALGIALSRVRRI
jgi:MFS family permease